MPVATVRKRRTRSRRTTRRLHRTRRHRRLQRGGAEERVSLASWLRTAGEKIAAVKDQGALSDILETLRDDRLQLSEATAPLITDFTSGTTEFFGEQPKTAQTLYTLASNILLRNGADIFANQDTFLDYVTRIQGSPDTDYDIGQGNFQFLQELETYLRTTAGSAGAFNTLTDKESYPLYIWVLVANHPNIKDPESGSAPILTPAMQLMPEPAPPAE
jgi:hypothetical protein